MLAELEHWGACGARGASGPKAQPELGRLAGQGAGRPTSAGRPTGARRTPHAKKEEGPRRRTASERGDDSTSEALRVWRTKLLA